MTSHSLLKISTTKQCRSYYSKKAHYNSICMICRSTSFTRSLSIISHNPQKLYLNILRSLRVHFPWSPFSTVPNSSTFTTIVDCARVVLIHPIVDCNQLDHLQHKCRLRLVCPPSWTMVVFFPREITFRQPIKLFPNLTSGAKQDENGWNWVSFCSYSTWFLFTVPVVLECPRVDNVSVLVRTPLLPFPVIINVNQQWHINMLTPHVQHSDSFQLVIMHSNHS